MAETTDDQQRRGSQSEAEEKLLVLKAGKSAGFIEYAYLAPKHLKRQFAEITCQTIDKQTEYWLKSFVREFEGKIDEVLELAEEFKAYLPDESDAASATHIDAFQAHVFLERKGQTLSVLELREVMRNICADDNDVSRFSFIEYLAWSYQKTLKSIFMVKPGNLEGLLKGLYQAMHEYQESKAVHDAKTDEIVEAMESATSVVKQRVLASQMKEVITRGCTRRKKDSVYHKYKQKKAQKQFEQRKADELAAKKLIEATERKAKRELMAAKMGAMDSVTAGGGSVDHATVTVDKVQAVGAGAGAGADVGAGAPSQVKIAPVPATVEVDKVQAGSGASSGASSAGDGDGATSPKVTDTPAPTDDTAAAPSTTATVCSCRRMKCVCK